MKKQILTAIAVSALLVGCSDNKWGNTSTRAKDVKVASQFNDLPPAVQKTVKQEVPNGIVDKISTETKDGQLVYKVKFQDEGLNPAIFVAADGTLLKSDISRDKAYGATGTPSELGRGTEGDIKFTQLPAAVQKTIRQQEPNAPIASIRKHTKDGVVVYDVSFKEKGLNPKITVAEDGTLLIQK